MLPVDSPSNSVPHGRLKLMSSRISRAEMKQVDELVSTYKNDTTIRRFLRTVVTQIQDAVEKDGPPGKDTIWKTALSEDSPNVVVR